MNAPVTFGRNRLVALACAVDCQYVSDDGGNFRGFLVLRSLDGARRPASEPSPGNLVECRTILRFKDGSLYDEALFLRRAFSGWRATV